MTLPTLDLRQTQLPQPPKGSIRKLLRRIEGSTNEYTLEIDASSLTTFMECPRAAQWHLVYSRSTYQHPALVFGRAIHAFLEHLYRENVRDMQTIYSIGQPFFEESPPATGEWRTFEQWLTVCEAYLKNYPTDSFTPIKSQNAEPYVECPFQIPLQVIEVNAESKFTAETLLFDHEGDTSYPYLGRINIIWTGVVDLVAQQQDGSIIIIDHKTSSVVGDSYFKGYELSQQFIGYAFAASKLLETSITKALLNVLACRRPTKTGKSVEFFRRLYLYRQDQLDEWPHSILSHCEDLLHRLTTGFFPMSTQWCVNKFGICAYHDVCTLPEPQRLTSLFSDAYTNNCWNPLT